VQTPSKVIDLIEEIQHIDRRALAPLLTAIAARMASTQADTIEPTAMPTDAGDVMLSTSEAGAILNRSTKWLYRHRTNLPFARKIGPRSYVWSRNELQKWLSRQRA